MSAGSIDWGKYFDRIYCVHYLPDTNRVKRLNNELSRVGIIDSPIFRWRYTVPNPYEKADNVRTQYVNLGLETLRYLKESWYLGHKRIMAIEDDIAFLKDKDEIVRILDHMPDKCGIIQMDKGLYKSECWMMEENIRERKLNDYFVESPYCFPYATCNVYNREGIEDAIRALESHLDAPDVIGRHTGKTMAVAIRNMAIQVVFDNACNLYYKPAPGLLGKYLSYGLHVSDYAVPPGYTGMSTVHG